MSMKIEPNRSVSSFVGVEKVPDVVRRLSLFDSLHDQPDYIDCFVLALPDAAASSPESWARAFLERDNAPRALYTFMGLRLGPPHSVDHVQGWRIERQTDRWLRLETSSWYMNANAVVFVEEDQVLASLSLHYTLPVAPLIWAPISRLHQHAVPVMLREAAKIVRGTTSAPGYADVNSKFDNGERRR
jgi:hypothetical protein